MVVEIFPYFTHDKLPDHSKESLWFYKMINEEKTKGLCQQSTAGKHL